MSKTFIVLYNGFQFLGDEFPSELECNLANATWAMFKSFQQFSQLELPAIRSLALDLEDEDLTCTTYAGNSFTASVDPTSLNRFNSSAVLAFCDILHQIAGYDGNL